MQFINCNMIPKIFAALLFLFFSITITAQNKTASLKIFVQTAKNDSANNATLQLFSLPDSTLIATQVASKNGNNFTVNNFSKYLIKVSCIGFIAIAKIINITDKPATITLILKTNTGSLKEVTVVSSKPLIKQEDDKTIIDAAPLANSSTNAFEVLEKTPSVIIDQDGNVYLNGNTPATVFINGREMKLSSEDIASLLKSLPAGSISKIEILRNPSAKYDAASSGGIVNIVLKKGVKLGSSGSFNIASFQGVYNTSTAGVNINKSFGKANTYFSYQFTNRNNYEILTSNRLLAADTSLVAQNSYTTYPSVNNYFSGGVDYAFNNKFNLAYDVRLNNTNGKSNAVSNNNIYQSATIILEDSTQNFITNKNNSFYITNAVSSKLKIDTAGSEWTAELDYNYYGNNNTQDYTNHYYQPLSPIINGNGITNNDKNVFVLQTDLVLKLPKKITLETGVKATISNSHNAANYFLQVGSGLQQTDPYQTNTFKYSETISAAYLQLSKTFFGFTLNPGLRLETTNINGEQIIPKDTVLSIKRFDVFPYLFLKHRLFKIFGKDLMGSAIYRKSIKRPYYEILNPFPKYIDQYLYEVGNPKLQPQFTTNYEFNITYTDIPVFAIGVNKTKDIFNSVTYQDNTTKIAYRTYDNLGNNKEIYFRMIAGIPPGKKYFFYMGFLYNYQDYDGLYQGLPLHYTHSSWTFFMHQEYKFTNSFTLSLHGFMRTNSLYNFYVLKNFGGIFLSATKNILQRKGSIILSLNDALQTNHVSFSLNQGNVNATGSRINDTRRLGLTFRYNFGLSKPKENKGFDTPAETKDN